MWSNGWGTTGDEHFTKDFLVNPELNCEGSALVSQAQGSGVKMKEERYLRQVCSMGKAPGLRNTHFVAARKSTRHVMAGKEAGKEGRGPDQRG